MEELSKRTGKYKLLNLSEVEQSICMDDDHTQIVQSIRDLIDDKDVNGSSILRLICLYAINYGIELQHCLLICYNRQIT